MRKKQLLLILICITSCTPSGRMANTDKSRCENIREDPAICVDGIYRTLDTSVFLCDTFEVFDINKEKGYYRIDVIRDNQYYPIISCPSQSKQVGCCKRIRKRDVYILKLIPIFEENRMPGGLVHLVSINNTKLELYRSYSTNLYICLDFDGKYYCGESNNYIPYKKTQRDQ